MVFNLRKEHVKKIDELIEQNFDDVEFELYKRGLDYAYKCEKNKSEDIKKYINNFVIENGKSDISAIIASIILIIIFVVII